jgi:hypothetical protein
LSILANILLSWLSHWRSTVLVFVASSFLCYPFLQSGEVTTQCTLKSNIRTKSDHF